MTTTIKSFADGALTGSLVDTFTSPDLTRSTVHSATYSNPTSGVVTLEVKIIVESGGTARSVVPPVNLSVNEVFIAAELTNKTLGPGGSIQASGLGIEFEYSGAQRPTV